MLIRKLNNKDYNNYYFLINQLKTTHFSKKEFKNTLKKIKKSNSEIWVLIENNIFVGSCTIIFEYKFIHNNSKIAHIEDLIINYQYRSKGMGKLLLNHLINYAKNKECYKIILNCDDELVCYYKKNGFIKKSNGMALYF